MRKHNNSVGFEVFMAVKIFIVIIRDTTPCSLVDGYERYYLHRQSGIEGDKFLRSVCELYNTTRRQNSEVHNPNLTTTCPNID
jgi:hypothetical protein